MNDEEKEAVEWLKRLVKINKRDNLDDTFAEILLNLVKNQSKEIEELKEENEKYKNPPFFDEDNYTENDKIKAKIEELEKQDRECRLSHNYLVIPVLQSLLKEE